MSPCEGYIANDLPERAIDLFRQVEHPDEVIIILLFSACAQVETHEALKLIKDVIPKIHGSIYSNPRLVTSLLDALMKCGDVIKAQSIFDSTPDKVMHMFGAMMTGEKRAPCYRSLNP